MINSRDFNGILDSASSLLGSNEGILISVVMLLVVFWVAKKIIKMVLGIAVISALVYYMTSGM